MSQSGLIVRVNEAESAVASLRDRFHPAARLGVPAHITVLFPFMEPKRISDVVIESVGAALVNHSSFEFSLSKVGRFPLTAFLAPQPSAPFVALTQSLVTAFPNFPPFGGEFETVIPHLTVAHGNAREAEIASGELSAILRSSGKINAHCGELELLENSSGRWRLMHKFPLAQTNKSTE